MFGKTLDKSLFVIVGALMGSFLGLLLERYPAWLRTPINDSGIKCLSIFAYPPSHCLHCFHRLNWYENIPIVSYLWLRGQCAFCQLPIPKYIWYIELISTVMSLILALDPRIHTLSCLWLLGAIAWVLLALGAFDYRYQLLPDFLTQSLLWSALILYSYKHHGWYLTQSVWGAVFGFGFLWLLQQAYWCVKNKPGMGDGDLKFSAALGSCLGVPSLMQVLSLSCCLAMLGISLDWLRGKPQIEPIPFGFFLAVGAGLHIFCFGPMGLVLG